MRERVARVSSVGSQPCRSRRRLLVSYSGVDPFSWWAMIDVANRQGWEPELLPGLRGIGARRPWLLAKSVRWRQPCGSSLTAGRHPLACQLAVPSSARSAVGFSSPSGAPEEDPAPCPQRSPAACWEAESAGCDCRCRFGLRRLRFFTCKDAGEVGLEEGVHCGPFGCGWTRCKDRSGP